MPTRALHHIFLASIASLALLAGPAQAQPEPEMSPLPEQSADTSVRRISLEAGAGLNLIKPFLHLRAAYRLPVVEDRIDLMLDYTPLAQSLNASAPEGWPEQQLLVGARGYFLTQGWFQPYLAFMTGLGFYTPGAGESSTGALGSVFGPLILPGLGADFMITPWFGINAQILMLRGELNLKFTF